MYGIFFGTLDGEVHLLKLPSSFDETVPVKTWHTSTNPVDGDPVIGKILSREYNLGDWDTLKQIRRIYTSITGENVDLTLHYINAAGIKESVQIWDNESLPENDNATPDVVNIPRRVRSVQIEIEGRDLILTSLDILWKQIRLS